MAEPAESAAAGLAALTRRGEELAARSDALEQEQRRAHEAARERQAELVAIERRIAAGETIPDAVRRKAEQALGAARELAGQPWTERMEGVRAAARDLVAERVQFIGAHADELVDGLEVEGAAAARELDEAARRVVEAFNAREQAAARILALMGEVRANARPSDVTYTRAETLAREARRLLQAGGERAPVLTVPFGQPRHGAVPAPVEAPASAA